MLVGLLGGGVSTELGHNRGPSLNLRNQHCSWENLTRPLAFCSTISRDSAWLRPCIRTVRFNAPAPPYMAGPGVGLRIRHGCMLIVILFA